MKESQFNQFFSWCGIEKGDEPIEKNGWVVSVSAQDDRNERLYSLRLQISRDFSPDRRVVLYP